MVDWIRAACLDRADSSEVPDDGSLSVRNLGPLEKERDVHVAQTLTLR